MGALPSAFDAVVTYLVPTVVWGLLTAGVYQLVREGRGLQATPEQLQDWSGDITAVPRPVVHPPRPSDDVAVLQVLNRAASEDAFIAQLSQDGPKALEGYNLTSAEEAALLSGDIRWIEAHVGKLTPRQKTWLYCKLEQENW